MACLLAFVACRLIWGEAGAYFGLAESAGAAEGNTCAKTAFAVGAQLGRVNAFWFPWQDSCSRNQEKVLRAVVHGAIHCGESLFAAS